MLNNDQFTYIIIYRQKCKSKVVISEKQPIHLSNAIVQGCLTKVHLPHLVCAIIDKTMHTRQGKWLHLYKRTGHEAILSLDRQIIYHNGLT